MQSVALGPRDQPPPKGLATTTGDAHEAEELIYQWVTGRFIDADLEVQFRASFFAARSAYMRRLSVILAIVFSALFVVYFIAVGSGAKGGIVQSGFFGNYRVVGHELAHTTMVTSLASCIAVVTILRTRLYNERTHMRVLGLSIVGYLVAFSWSTLGVAGYRLLASYWLDEALDGQDQPTIPPAMQPAMNCSDAPTVRSRLPTPLRNSRRQGSGRRK